MTKKQGFPLILLEMIVLSISALAQPRDSMNVRMLGMVQLPSRSNPTCVTWTDCFIVVGRASTDNGDLGYDVSNPSRIRLRWEEPIRNYRYGTQAALYEDSILYEATQTYGRMSRVTAQQLQPVDSFGDGGWLISLTKRGDSLYFGTLQGKIVFAYDSAHTRLLRPVRNPTLWLPTAYCALAWQDRYLFALDRDFGLKVYTTDDPIYPQLAVSLAMPDDPFDLKLLGNRAYIAADQAGVIIMDLTNPEQPTMLSQFNLGGRSLKLAIVGTYLYVADQERGLRIFTLQDPDHPIEIGHYNRGDGIRCFSVHDSLVYACDSEYLMVFDCRQALPVSGHSSSEQPNRITLLTNYPNPFNSSTIFRYQLAAMTPAALTVYDILGRIVWEYPIGAQKNAGGAVIWTGLSQVGSPVASGTYFCRLANHHESKTIKIQLLR